MCKRGKIANAMRAGHRVWLIPKDALRPIDRWTKAAKEANQNKDGVK
jgi:hypothetical protein